MPAGKPGVITPYPLAMVVCDMIWEDRTTGKYFLLGTFSEIYASSFPAVHPSLCVYTELTDGLGTMPVRIRIVDVDEKGEEIASSQSDVTFEDPRSILQASVLLRQLRFPEPGEYRIQLFAGGEFLIERRIFVRLQPSAEEK